jgi:phosphoglycolate phosphatase
MTKLFIKNQEVLNDPQLIMLDKDGTVIDIHHYWGSMIKERAGMVVDRWFVSERDQNKIQSALIDAMGVDLETGRLKPEGPVGIKSRPYIVSVAVEVVKKHGVNVNEEEMEILFKNVDQKTAQDISSFLRILPFVESFLQKCDDANIKLAIVTTDITERAKAALKALGIIGYFHFVVGGDQVESTKPSPDIANIVLRDSNIKTSKTVVIGDHLVDVKMGINCGAACNVGVLTGLGTINSFSKEDCYIIDSFEQVDIR